MELGMIQLMKMKQSVERILHVPGNYKGHLSRTCHSLEDIKANKKGHEYLFFNPVFDEHSKQSYMGDYTPLELRKAHKAGIIDKKVIALGGIDIDNIRQVKDYGFGGAAIMGALWNRFDTCCDCDYSLIIDHFKKLKKLAD